MSAESRLLPVRLKDASFPYPDELLSAVLLDRADGWNAFWKLQEGGRIPVLLLQKKVSKAQKSEILVPTGSLVDSQVYRIATSLQEKFYQYGLLPHDISTLAIHLGIIDGIPIPWVKCLEVYAQLAGYSIGFIRSRLPLSAGDTPRVETLIGTIRG